MRFFTDSDRRRPQRKTGRALITILSKTPAAQYEYTSNLYAVAHLTDSLLCQVMPS